MYRTRTERVIRKQSGIFSLALITTSNIKGASQDKVPASINEAVSSKENQTRLRHRKRITCISKNWNVQNRQVSYRNKQNFQK